MFVTKYDQASGTAFTMEVSSYLHMIIIAVAIVTAPVLGTAAYVISLFVDPEVQGAVFIASWFGMLVATFFGAAIYMIVRQVRGTKSYYENLPRY